jgi:putative ABC transport system permease protein
MLVWKMAVAGIRARKGDSLLLFLLVVLVSLFAITSFNIKLSAERLWESEFQAQGCPDYAAYFINEKLGPEYVGFFEKHPDSIGLRQRAMVMLSAEQNKWSHRDGYSLLLFSDPSVRPGEVFAPYYQIVQGDVALGDTMTISIGSNTMTLTASDAYTDAVSGSAMMGTQFLPVSPADYRTLSSWGLEITELGVWLQPGTDTVALNRDFGHSSDAEWIWTKDEAKGIALVVPDMISYFLIAVALILVLATLVALRHCIVSALESQYKTIGTLKAIGADNAQVVSYIMLQYMALAVLGSLSGAALSIAVQEPTLYLFLSFSGLVPKLILFPEMIAAVAVGICAVVLATAWTTSRRVYRLSPVRAISLGQAPVHFSKRWNPPLRRLAFLPLTLRLALKQALCRFGQFMALLIVAMIFSYSLITLFGFYSTMTDQRQAAGLFGQPTGDISVAVKLDGHGQDMADIDEITARLGQLSAIGTSYETIQGYAEVDGLPLRVSCFSDYSLVGLPEPISGRFPKYANEAMTTPQLSKLLGVGIGDRLSIRSGGQERQMIITGLTSAVNDMGKIVFCTTESELLASQLGSTDSSIGRAFLLADASSLDAVVEKLNAEYGDVAYIQDMHKSITNVTNGIRMGILSLTLLVILMALLLVLLTTTLLARIAIGREQSDMGVLRAMGYSSTQLVWQFTLRFLLLSLAGSMLGLLLELAFSDAMMSAVLGMAGISRFVGDKSAVVLLSPIAIICGLTTVFAWLGSRRLRKASLRQLTTE